MDLTSHRIPSPAVSNGMLTITKESEMVLHTEKEAKSKAEVWFKGNKAFFTGKTEIIYGGLFAEAKLVDSDKTVLIQIKP